ncbi:hypothetical protein FPANT_9317 [Fusarium pseudoanthophilum]|uniref:F-box domain-containing protein n=1 Tax=Fusarium pseudoanthophilum TaxID=48495 RepID=A0A8H5NXD8_9HYPO|nr:hypothetical protein FPANT_9317 [Fusarium pseudoanthophilum]
MALLGLPPEILRKIFDQLDPSFFQEDLSRLTVTKKWLEFALPACHKRVTLSHEALRILAASSVAKGPSPVEGHLETVNIDIHGFQHGISTHSPQEDEQGSTSQPTAPYIYPWDNQVRDWRVALDDGLAQLAIVAQQSPRLRTLRMRATSSSLEFPLFPPGGYLSLSTMRALLSVENLSVLVLDLSGTTLNSSGLTQVDEPHICPFISALLHSLKTLHLRLCSICPDALKTQGPDTKLRLSTVAINLCLPPDQPRILPWNHSTPCKYLAGGLTQLRDDIQEQAKVLVTRMQSPKTIRILTHPFRQLDTQSLDVLTGKTMKLEDDAAWDEDGETVAEAVYEDSELEADFDTPIFQTPIFQAPDDEFDDFLFD